MLRRCKTCTLTKPIDAFIPTTSGYTWACRDCRNKYFREFYKTSNARRTSIHIAAKNRRQLYGERIFAYLSSHPCIDCGETDPLVLEFDHTRGVKTAAVSALWGKTTWDKVENEIAKCDVRCANCHRRKTAITLGWYNYLPPNQQSPVRFEPGVP